MKYTKYINGVKRVQEEWSWLGPIMKGKREALRVGEKYYFNHILIILLNHLKMTCFWVRESISGRVSLLEIIMYLGCRDKTSSALVGTNPYKLTHRGNLTKLQFNIRNTMCTRLDLNQRPFQCQ